MGATWVSNGSRMGMPWVPPPIGHGYAMGGVYRIERLYTLYFVLIIKTKELVPAQKGLDNQGQPSIIRSNMGTPTPRIDHVVKPEAPKGIDISAILELRIRNPKATLEEMSLILGCSKQNLSARLQAYKTELESLPHFKKNRIDVVLLGQQRALAALTNSDVKVETARDFKDMATGAAILMDKEQQLLGKSGGGPLSLAEIVEGVHSGESITVTQTVTRKRERGPAPQQVVVDVESADAPE